MVYPGGDPGVATRNPNHGLLSNHLAADGKVFSITDNDRALSSTNQCDIDCDKVVTENKEVM